MVMMRRRHKLYFDGGCRPNPGPMEVALVVRGQTHFFDDLGTGSSSDAEWQALICAIALARTIGLEDVVLVGDSLNVIRQANLAMVTGHAGVGHAAKLLSLVAQHRPGAIRWVKRQQNLAGIALDARRVVLTVTR